MTNDDTRHVTRMVTELAAGSGAAAAQLMPLVYEELRGLAGKFMRSERPDHTLQPTALVHEACARLLGSDDVQWQDHVHFKAVAARAMRRLLINHARDRGALKRGGSDRVAITLNEALAEDGGRAIDVLDLGDALERLAALSARQAQVVELRYFGGMTFEETAEVLGIGVTTAKAEWTVARAWLGGQLSDGAPS